jgi:hypothetical protein
MKYCTLSGFIFLIAFGVQVRAQGNLTLQAQVTVASQDLRPCEEFKIGIITPPKEIDFKMTIVRPDPNVDFKGIIIKPCEESNSVALTPSVNIFPTEEPKPIKTPTLNQFPARSDLFQPRKQLDKPFQPPR